MPDLNFRVIGVEAASQGVLPLLRFRLEIENPAKDEIIQSVMLQAQVQLQCPQRAYGPAEKANLVELFGKPENWGQTLRNRLWTHTSTVVGSFCGRTETMLPVPCSFDLNLAATKYLYALQDGEVSLLFLFAGTAFYSGPAGRLQVQMIPRDKECTWRMPISVWREMMDHHWPNSAWLMVHRDLFDRLVSFKRSRGLVSWDDALAHLLDAVGGEAIAETSRDLAV